MLQSPLRFQETLEIWDIIVILSFPDFVGFFLKARYQSGNIRTNRCGHPDGCLRFGGMRHTFGKIFFSSLPHLLENCVSFPDNRFIRSIYLSCFNALSNHKYLTVFRFSFTSLSRAPSSLSFLLLFVVLLLFSKNF